MPNDLNARPGRFGVRFDAAVRRARRLIGVALIGVLAVPAPARADGDPASDVLPGLDIYYGFGVNRNSQAAAQLPALLAEAHARGYPLKVVLIGRITDLGLERQFWPRPQDYARFLGGELTFVYKNRLLVVMPNGFGIYAGGRVPGIERRTLSFLAPPGSPDRLLPVAITAVLRLAAANGIRLTVPDVHPPPGGVQTLPTAQGPSGSPGAVTPRATPVTYRNTTPTWPFLLPVATFALIGAGALIVRRRRTRAEPTDESR